MTNPDPKNYCLFPIPPNERNLYELYKKSIGVFWIAEEINYTTRDKDDWTSLTVNEQYFIKNILAFFAGSDGVVSENLGTNFQSESTSNVVKLFYGFQNAMEGIHSEVYSSLIEFYIEDNEEKHRLFGAIETIPIIKKKAEWCFKYMNKSIPLNERLVAFSAVEGIFFSGAFCSIFWLKKRNLLPALTLSNEFISRDEGLHTEFAVEYSKYLAPLEPNKLKEILLSAVELEKEFIIESLPCNLIGMNSKLMSEYIEFVADRLSQQYGQPKLFGSRNPFDFMESISMERKTNFFEGRVAEYTKNKSEKVFTTSEDF